MDISRIFALVGLLVLAGCGDDDKVDGDDDDDAADSAVDDEISLEPGFALLEVSGETTGTETSTSCDGFFPAEPSARVLLTASFVGLSVQVNSGLPLRMTFGASNFCGTGEGGDPTVIERGSWSAGMYDVYVGTATEGATANYTLRFNENQ